MDGQKESFGWQTDTDFNENEFCHPDLTQVSSFLDMIYAGRVPQLEWKSPGRRLGGAHQNVVTAKPVDNSSSSHTFQSQTRSLSNKAPTAIASAYDFDDSEPFLPAFPSSGLSPPKSLDSRKRVVGTLSNVLQSVQQADKIKPEPPTATKVDPSMDTRLSQPVPMSPSRTIPHSAPSPIQPQNKVETVLSSAAGVKAEDTTTGK